jgi:hypothetical protein
LLAFIKKQRNFLKKEKVMHYRRFRKVNAEKFEKFKKLLIECNGIEFVNFIENSIKPPFSIEKFLNYYSQKHPIEFKNLWLDISKNYKK